MKRFLLCLVAGLTSLPAASATLSVPPVAREARAHGCGDVLAAMGHKPRHLIFTGCTYRPEAQGKPLRALYRVAGRYAAATEAYFVRRAGLTPLKRSCCQWDGPAGHLRDAAARDVTVTMVSPETAVRTRARWRAIPAFEVVVETFTEEI